MSTLFDWLFKRKDNTPEKAVEKPVMKDAGEQPGSGEHRVTEGWLPHEYALVRTVWELDTRDASGEGKKSEIGLYRDKAGSRYFLYYSEYAYSTHFAAGAIPGKRYYFEITAAESALDDATLRDLAFEAKR